VSKRDTLNIVGFVKGNRLNEKGWDGYVFTLKPSKDSCSISYHNTQFVLQWSQEYYAGVGVDVIYHFINNDSNLVYSLRVTEDNKNPQHNYRKHHGYTRIYGIDKKYTKKFSAQYYHVDFWFICFPQYQFEDGGYLLNIQTYAQLADIYSSQIARTNNKGEILSDSSLFQSYYWPFKDVSLFDPFADNTDTTNIGMKAFKNSYSLRIYPNPTSSTLYLELNSNQTVNYTLQNLNGQSLIEGRFVGSTQINTGNLPNGIYFLHLQGEGILETRKIVVQR
jgi:hypothetical protein